MTIPPDPLIPPKPYDPAYTPPEPPPMGFAYYPWPGAGPQPTPPTAPPMASSVKRSHLPNQRRSITRRIEHTPQLDIYIIVGFYNNDTSLPGEVFIKIAKEGSTLSGLMDCLAVCMSLMLQYGVPWERIARKLRHTNFEPLNAEGKSIAHAIVTAVDDIITIKKEPE